MKNVNKQKPEFATVWQNFDDFKEHKLEIYFGLDKIEGRNYLTFVIDGENKYVVERLGKNDYELINTGKNDLSKLLGEIAEHWDRLCELYKHIK